MKSSFKKNEKSKNKDDLNKSFFGHPELDAIFQNSLKKGSSILIEEDFPTSMHVSLNRYFIGSAFHSDQKSIVYDVFSARWHEMIPVKSTREEKREQEKSQNQQTENSKIAWRYDSQVIKLKQECLNNDIPRLDLSRNVTEKEKIQQLIQVRNVNDFTNLKELLEDIVMGIQNILNSANDTSLKKLCITNLFGNFSKIKYSHQELVKFIFALKTIVRSAHILCVLTIPPTISDQIKSLFYMNFDLVLKLLPLFENNEFTDFNGMLHIIKFPQVNNYLNFKIESLVWGIKASSKKRIEIDKLYLTPPEQDNINNDNVYKEENKTQTVICSNKPGGINQDLKF